MIRDDVKAAQIAAMKAGDKDRTAAIRLILAKFKDRDIELRGKEVPDEDAMLIEAMQKMAKQRRESITMFTDGGRTELAAGEQHELDVIEEFLPSLLSEEDTMAAIKSIADELGATSIKDMGKVMAELKKRHASVLDMSKASGMVKAALA